MLYLPYQLPCIETLRSEGYAVKSYALRNTLTCATTDVAGHCNGAKRVILLNLMPQKAVTELDIARMMGAAGCDVQLILTKIPGQTYKTTPAEHMQAFYVDMDEELMANNFDGLIITGAPVEHLDFEQVRYWRELTQIMTWSKKHAKATLNICWGAQAALYHHFGINKQLLPKKCFGIFEQEVTNPDADLFRGVGKHFHMPHSRHTKIVINELPQGLKVVAASRECGPSILVAPHIHQVFIIGHMEYEPYTLHKEYMRDVAKQLPIEPPCNYYHNGNIDEGVDFVWGEAARKIYANWLTYYCK